MNHLDGCLIRLPRGERQSRVGGRAWESQGPEFRRCLHCRQARGPGPLTLLSLSFLIRTMGIVPLMGSV